MRWGARRREGVPDCATCAATDARSKPWSNQTGVGGNSKSSRLVAVTTVHVRVRLDKALDAVATCLCQRVGHISSDLNSPKKICLYDRWYDAGRGSWIHSNGDMGHVICRRLLWEKNATGCQKNAILCPIRPRRKGFLIFQGDDVNKRALRRAS